MSKGHALSSILGYKPHSKVSIDYVPSLNDWKIAWDFIHFQGFLNTNMKMYFIWEGCDSILAAPLVLDLVRLLKYAKDKNEKGTAKDLAVFFKSPLGSTENDHFKQFQMLYDYLNKK